MKKPIIFATKDELCQIAINKAVKKKAKQDAHRKYEDTFRRAEREHGISSVETTVEFENSLMGVRMLRMIVIGAVCLLIGIMIISAL